MWHDKPWRHDIILSIQYLRALAAFLVLAHHVAGKSQPFGGSPVGDFVLGNLGVDLFFIISGFIMCLVGKNMTVTRFFMARCTRILPLYWLLTSLALVIFLIWPEKVNSSGGTTSILGSYTLIPVWRKFLLQNGWTLNYEIAFYAVFPLALVSKVSGKLWVAAFAIITLVMLGKVLPVAIFTDPLMLEFVFGMCLYALRPRLGIRPLWGLAWLTAGAAYLYVSYHFSPYRERFAIAGISAAMLVAGLLTLETWLLRWQATWPGQLLRSLGDSSYALYLSHPFTLVLGVTMIMIIPAQLPVWLIMAGLILLALLGGHVCHVLVERPLSRLFHSRRVLTDPSPSL